MKKKDNYSLTAKERKALRRGGNEKKIVSRRGEPIASNAAETPVAVPGESGAVATKRRIWVPVTCAVVALVLILTAVILLVIVPTYKSKYPRAVIYLSDGRQLTMTIWEDECPIAATNFIFLAKIGFFDGTIIYDVHHNNSTASDKIDHNYMRFGAFTDYSSNATRYTDEKFLKSIPRSIFNVVNVDSQYKPAASSNLFGYRLLKDRLNGAAAARYINPYVVSYNIDNSADYVINLAENNTVIDRDLFTSATSSLVAFGSFDDEESQKILDEIYSRDTIANTGIEGAFGLTERISITKIKLVNLNRKKWKNFEFVSYMKTAYKTSVDSEGSSAFSAWRT